MADLIELSSPPSTMNNLSFRPNPIESLSLSSSASSSSSSSSLSQKLPFFGNTRKEGFFYDEDDDCESIDRYEDDDGTGTLQGFSRVRKRPYSSNAEKCRFNQKMKAMAFPSAAFNGVVPSTNADGTEVSKLEWIPHSLSTDADIYRRFGVDPELVDATEEDCFGCASSYCHGVTIKQNNFTLFAQKMIESGSQSNPVLRSIMLEKDYVRMILEPHRRFSKKTSSSSSSLRHKSDKKSRRRRSLRDMDIPYISDNKKKRNRNAMENDESPLSLENDDGTTSTETTGDSYSFENTSQRKKRKKNTSSLPSSSQTSLDLVSLQTPKTAPISTVGTHCCRHTTSSHGIHRVTSINDVDHSVPSPINGVEGGGLYLSLHEKRYEALTEEEKTTVGIYNHISRHGSNPVEEVSYFKRMLMTTVKTIERNGLCMAHPTKKNLFGGPLLRIDGEQAAIAIKCIDMWLKMSKSRPDTMLPFYDPNKSSESIGNVQMVKASASLVFGKKRNRNTNNSSNKKMMM